METIESTSTFFFVGRISDHSAKYQVQQEPLLDGFYLEVFLDGIAIWGSSDETFLVLYPKVIEMLQTIIAAFTFKSDTPLSFTLVNWIETQEIVSTNNMIGWLLPRLSTTKPSSRRSPINTPWKKSAWFYRNFMKQGNINHRLALKDYYQARVDQSDDAFFYAYRAIEDICRAATGEDEIDKSTWPKMHRLLGTNKSLISPLTDIATLVRHGDTNNQTITNARANRASLINIAHQVISAEMERTLPKFYK